MGMRNVKRIQVFDAQTAPTNSTAINVADYKHIIFTHATAASSDQVVKLQAAIGLTSPDFTAAKAVENEWDYVETIDLEDKSSVDGDVGVTFAGADVRQFVVDVEALDWIAFEISVGTAGALSTKLSAYTNA